jgi:hypothetical protein
MAEATPTALDVLRGFLLAYVLEFTHTEVLSTMNRCEAMVHEITAFGIARVLHRMHNVQMMVDPALQKCGTAHSRLPQPQPSNDAVRQWLIGLTACLLNTQDFSRSDVSELTCDLEVVKTRGCRPDAISVAEGAVKLLFDSDVETIFDATFFYQPQGEKGVWMKALAAPLPIKLGKFHVPMSVLPPWLGPVFEELANGHPATNVCVAPNVRVGAASDACPVPLKRLRAGLQLGYHGQGLPEEELILPSPLTADELVRGALQSAYIRGNHLGTALLSFGLHRWLLEPRHACQPQRFKKSAFVQTCCHNPVLWLDHPFLLPSDVDREPWEGMPAVMIGVALVNVAFPTNGIRSPVEPGPALWLDGVVYPPQWVINGVQHGVKADREKNGTTTTVVGPDVDDGAGDAKGAAAPPATATVPARRGRPPTGWERQRDGDDGGEEEEGEGEPPTRSAPRREAVVVVEAPARPVPLPVEPTKQQRIAAICTICGLSPRDHENHDGIEE